MRIWTFQIPQKKAVIKIVDLQRLDGENEKQYLWRLGQAKDAGLLDIDWDGIAALMNREFADPDKPYGESAWRKPYQQARDFFEAGVFQCSNETEYLDELRLQKQELQKERRKLLDERLDINRRLRQEARMETTVEKLEEMLYQISDRRYFFYSPPMAAAKTDMIVCLSDLHIGAAYSNFDGTYNSDIAKARLSEYLNEILEIQNTHQAENCVVMALGDLISGNIHSTISVTNKENVIEQVKLACEFISDFVYELGRHFRTVEFRSVNGNHSRIAKKDEALADERLDAIIPWFVQSMLRNCPNIRVADGVRELDSTLSAFVVRDRLYFGIHGDCDTITDSGIAKLALWAKKTPYCVLTGHKHFPAMTDVSGIKVIQSGSLCGSGDEFTRQKRLSGEPSQTVLVVDEAGIRAVYPVVLT